MLKPGATVSKDKLRQLEDLTVVHQVKKSKQEYNITQMAYAKAAAPTAKGGKILEKSEAKVSGTLLINAEKTNITLWERLEKMEKRFDELEKSEKLSREKAVEYDRNFRILAPRVNLVSIVTSR